MIIVGVVFEMQDDIVHNPEYYSHEKNLVHHTATGALIAGCGA